MRFLALKLIDFYQIFISPQRGLLMLFVTPLPCKYEISCSEFTKMRIKEVGIIRGTWDGIRRVISCS